jgi:hypothetical protein
MIIDNVCFEFLMSSEAIKKRLKSKVNTSDSERESESEDISRDPLSSVNNDNQAAHDDADNNRTHNYRRQEVNASKKQTTQHSKTLQTLVNERKKKLG